MHFKLALSVLALTILFMLSSCGLVYKQDIQQGNSLKQEDVEQLEVGMTRRQVIVLLGTPAIQDPFHQDRWDYVYTFARRGKPITDRSLTLNFDGDTLASIEGDVEDPLAGDERDALGVAEQEAEADADADRSGDEQPRTEGPPEPQPTGPIEPDADGVPSGPQ